MVLGTALFLDPWSLPLAAGLPWKLRAEFGREVGVTGRDFDGVGFLEVAAASALDPPWFNGVGFLGFVAASALDPPGFIDLTVFLGLPPVLQIATLLAKLREQSVSCAWLSSGATLSIINVFPWPDKHGSNK